MDGVFFAAVGLAPSSPLLCLFGQQRINYNECFFAAVGVPIHPQENPPLELVFCQDDLMPLNSAGLCPEFEK